MSYSPPMTPGKCEWTEGGGAGNGWGNSGGRKSASARLLQASLCLRRANLSLYNFWKSTVASYFGRAPFPKSRASRSLHSSASLERRESSLLEAARQSREDTSRRRMTHNFISGKRLLNVPTSASPRAFLMSVSSLCATLSRNTRHSCCVLTRPRPPWPRPPSPDARGLE